MKRFSVPPGASVLLGKSDHPLPLAEAIGAAVLSAGGVEEVHLPECFVAGIMERPAQVLVLVLAPGADPDKVVDGVVAAVSMVLPPGQELDLWPLAGNSEFLAQVRAGGCELVARKTEPRLGVILKCAAGAALGGLVGYNAFFWIARQGFYMLMLPGTLLGFGGGWPLVRRSPACGWFCAVAALPLGLLTEWRFAPFIKDRSWSYFLAHAFDLRPVTLMMIVAGSALAFWLGQGRDSR